MLPKREESLIKEGNPLLKIRLRAEDTIRIVVLTLLKLTKKYPI